MQTRIVFVLPQGSDAVSGGNIYNAALIGALLETVDVTVIGIDECDSRLRRGEPGLYFIDTLNLREFLALQAPTKEQMFALIVHHLASLEPGIKPDDPALGVEAQALERFVAYVATSPFTADHLVQRGVLRERIMTVVPGMFDVDTSERVYEPPLRALLVGNLIRRKAVLEFLDAVDRRIDDKDSFNLQVIGRTDIDRDYGKACEGLISRSPRLKRSVQMRGPVPYQQMGEYYRSANALVSAAEMETYGMALAEARAHGLPILALDRGYVRNHLTHGNNGMLFDSINALADGFVGLARTDAEMRGFFVRAQTLRAGANYPWRSVAKSFKTELESVMEFHRDALRFRQQQLANATDE